MSGFFEEVQRRKVYRVAVAYAVAAGGIIQLASAAFPAWELPNWTLRLVIVLLLIGFPIALIFAWVFDVTPEGIQRTSKVETVRSTPRRRNIAILVGIGLIISLLAGFFLLPRASARRMDKSIAVLPFENLSDDKENAFFADGIQDDILTNLSKIGDLKVVSRTSVMSYRGKPSSVREIGKMLGVSTILEGTVRKSGNRVRLNVQLINAENDEHVWAQEYDRDLTDVFEIQTDLAQKIANELQAKLSPMEKAHLTRKPTENTEAYFAFVQAHDLQSKLESYDKLKQAEQLYERALQLDPNFAIACAGYSQLESWILHTYDPSPARREKARALANRALQLQPDLPEGHLALGFSLYYGDSNYDGALREFEIAQRGLPNAAEVHLALGAIHRRQGRWNESEASFEKSATLNPKDTWALQNLALNHEMRRDFEKTNQTLDRALRIEPDSFILAGLKAKAAVEEKGDFSVAQRMFEKIERRPHNDEEWFYVCTEVASMQLLQRNFQEAVKRAEEVKDGVLMHEKPDAVAAKYVTIGIAKRSLHDEACAREAFAKVKQLAQARVDSNPADPDGQLLLACAFAYLGEKGAALTAAQRALQLLPVSKDAFHGPDILDGVAQIYGVLGEKEKAFQTLEELSKIPSPVTAALLKLSPNWDGLRDDPRFDQLTAKFSGKI